jgi:hypothetical protein
MKTNRRLMNRDRGVKISYQFKRRNVEGFGDITLFVRGALNDSTMKDVREHISSRNNGANIVILGVFPLGG